MKSKILEQLKTKYSNLGFSKEVLEGVATQLSTFVTDEDKIATSVEGAESMLKAFQSFADSRVSTYKTETDSLKRKLAEVEKQKGEPTEPPKEAENVPEYVKQMQETMVQMQQTLQGFQTQQVSQDLKQSFISKMKEESVPESFYDSSLVGREFENNEKVDELANIVFKNYDIFKQSATDLGFSYTKPPENGGDPEKETEELANAIRKGTQELINKNE